MVIGIVQCRPASGVFATRPRRVLPENREAGLVEIPRRTGSTKGIAHVWNKCPLPALRPGILFRNMAMETVCRQRRRGCHNRGVAIAQVNRQEAAKLCCATSLDT